MTICGTQKRDRLGQPMNDDRWRMKILGVFKADLVRWHLG